MRGTLDAEGLFTERVYDSAGREVQRITYGTRVENQGANPSFASAKPASSYQDIVEYKFYNGLGRLTGTLDGEGYLTEFVYDASGNLTTKVRYATSLTGANTGSTMPVKYSPDIAKMRPATSAQDQVWTYTYTRLDKVSSERNAEGALTLYVYDEMGRMTSMVRAAGTSTSRGVLSRYDLQGRLIGELSGEGAARIDGNQTQAQIDDIWRAYGTSYTYDAVGRRTSMVDGAGQRTLYYFDANDGHAHHQCPGLCAGERIRQPGPAGRDGALWRAHQYAGPERRPGQRCAQARAGRRQQCQCGHSRDLYVHHRWARAE
ncbi:hypothetical protein WJ968_20125 [Achromobacter xylosoxidans]